MDIEMLRFEFQKLLKHADSFKEQLGAYDDTGQYEIDNIFERFSSNVEEIMTCLEKDEKKAVLRKSVEKFLQILPPGSMAEEYEQHSKRLVGLMGSQELSANDLNPYIVFAALVEKHDLDLDDKDFDLLDGHFGAKMTRPLYQGKYRFKEDEAEDESVLPPVENVEMPEIIQEPETYEIITQKLAPFSPKAFVSDYTSKKFGGRFIVKPNRKGELLLFRAFAWLGALNKKQLECYVFNDELGEEELKKVCAGGYVSVIKHIAEDTDYYALSSKGIAIFHKTSSRELMKEICNLPLVALDAEVSIAGMKEDILSYVNAATVGLFICNKSDLSIERIHTGTGHTVILVASEKRKKGHVKAFVITGRNGKVVFLPVEKLPVNRKERISFIEQLIHNDDTVCYFCNISHDYSDVSLYDDKGEFIDILELIGNISPPLDSAPEENVIAEEQPFMTDTVIFDESTIELTEPAEAVEVSEFAEVVSATCGTVEDEINDCQDIPDNSFNMAAKLLADNISPSDSGAFIELINRLLEEALNKEDGNKTDYIGRGVFLAKTLALADKEKYDGIYQRLMMATDMPIDHRSYSMEEMSTLFAGENEGTYLHLASLLRALFCPDSQYDFTLTDYAKKLFDQYDQVFEPYPSLKGLLSEFSHIGDFSREGFTDTVINRFVSEHDRRLNAIKMGAEASDLLKPPRINQRFNGVPEMLEECFGPNSVLGMCIHIIAENKTKEMEFVCEVQNLFTDGGKPSPQKIDDFIDETWRKVRQTSKKWVKDTEFYSTARRKTIYAINQRLDIISRWLAFNSTPSSEENTIIQLHKRLSECVEEAVKNISRNSELPKADSAVLLQALNNLAQRLKGGRPASFTPEDWLSAGVFPVDDGVPVIDEAFSGILYYEPWRNALRHISSKPEKLEDVLTQIEDSKSPLYDNYGQAILISEYLEIEKDHFQISINNARLKADEENESFLQQIGLDFANGRLTEQTREIVSGELEQLKTDFFERNNFAQLRSFRRALRRRADEEIEGARLVWEKAIGDRQNGHESDCFLKRAKQHLDSGSFLLVEEALNYFDSGADPAQMEINLSEEDFFSEFINPKNYSELEKFCIEHKRSALRNIAEKWITRKITTVGQYFKSAKILLENLPNEPGEPSELRIKAMLEELGFTPISVKRENRNDSPARLKATVKPELKNRESYTHPIAEMGTLMEDSLNIMVLFGNMQPKSIIDIVRKTNLKCMPLVFMNGFLSLKDRRQLAKVFLSEGNAQTPFILIDWVLLLHLATKAKAERLRILLACAMPYTGAKQLFTASSIGPVAGEMYIGRMEQIRMIIDINGPVIVYGGRQLGKTALLLRAKELSDDKEHGYYSVYVDVKGCHDEESFVTKIIETAASESIKLQKVKTIKAFCEELSKWLGDKNRKLLLLMDESDDILTELSKTRYLALLSFESVFRETGRFKFVFAGLHNVFLAAKDENTIFGHFGIPICIRPLSQKDAYRLLARPLRYLGFNTEQDKLLSLLVNTNFYPGVVHSVGEKIIKMLIYDYSKHYNDNDNPPYTLEDRQIGSIMKSADLSNFIDKRLTWTLEADLSYFMLARCIAILYYENPQRRSIGYNIEEIKEYANNLLGIKVLKDMTVETYKGLLSEMCDMSILVESEGYYRFRQSRFLSIVGKSVDDIINNIDIAQGGAE